MSKTIFITEVGLRDGLQSLKEIWFSKKAIKIRSLLNQSNRNFSPCNVCDVKGDLIGSKHVEAWQKLTINE